MKAIPTTYDGIQFRSRLEARYAAFFDEHKIGWSYEVEGIELGAGKRYLPDFWLPDCRVFFEVKGPLKDRLELVALAQAQMDEQSGGWMEPDYPLFVSGNEIGRLVVPSLKYAEGFQIQLWKCRECLCWYPCPVDGGWRCRACGHYDGDQTCSEQMEVVKLPQMQWKPVKSLV